MKRLSFQIGDRTIGNGNPVLIQTMGDHKTEDYITAYEETNRLKKMGLDLMRFSVLDKEDAKAFSRIRSKTDIPLIADIHFDSNLALAAIEAGADKIRINPGNIGGEAKLRTVIRACREKRIPMRIGVNSGSLMAFRGKTSSPVDDFFLALDDTLRVFKEEDYDLLVLSLKSSDPKEAKILYERAYRDYPYPLHIGVTESGFGTMGSLKSAYGLIPLLEKGIGDTIRVSLSDDRKEELRACKTLLSLTGRRKDIPDLIVCPACGRTKIDLRPISRLVADHLDYILKPVKVAVMGCPVNGIGEARNADYGIAGSGMEGVYLLFQKGKSLGTFPEKEALAKLFALIDGFQG